MQAEVLSSKRLHCARDDSALAIPLAPTCVLFVGDFTRESLDKLIGQDWFSIQDLIFDCIEHAQLVRPDLFDFAFDVSVLQLQKSSEHHQTFDCLAEQLQRVYPARAHKLTQYAPEICTTRHPYHLGTEDV